MQGVLQPAACKSTVADWIRMSDPNGPIIVWATLSAVPFAKKSLHSTAAVLCEVRPQQK